MIQFGIIANQVEIGNYKWLAGMAPLVTATICAWAKCIGYIQ